MALFFGPLTVRITQNWGLIMTVTDYQETFQIGRVVSRALGVFSSNAITFLAVTAAFIAPMTLISFFLSKQMLAVHSNDPAVMAQNFGSYFGLLGLSLIVTTVFYYTLQACLVQATLSDLNGEKPQIVPTLSAGLRLLLPITILSILAGLGVIIGFMLLVIPGIILAIWWAVIIPVRTMEGTGITETFARSRALTKGHRWKILWLFMMLIGLFILVGLVAALVTGVGFLNPDLAASLTTWPVIVNALVSIPLYGIAAAGVASIYFELRLVKEGIGSHQVAAAFD